MKPGVNRVTVALDEVSRIFLVRPHRKTRVELLSEEMHVQTGQNPECISISLT